MMITGSPINEHDAHEFKMRLGAQCDALESELVAWQTYWASLYGNVGKRNSRRVLRLLAAPPGISMMMTIMQRERRRGRREKKSAKGRMQSPARSLSHPSRGSQFELRPYF